VKHVDVYADGACSGNPGPGGYGAILIYKETRRELSAGCASTTNNREELKGIIAALEALKEPCVVTVYSDSAYIVHAFHRNWFKGWIARGWRQLEESARPQPRPLGTPDRPIRTPRGRWPASCGLGHRPRSRRQRAERTLRRARPRRDTARSRRGEGESVGRSDEPIATLGSAGRAFGH
jgi:ribonuclease HI